LQVVQLVTTPAGVEYDAFVQQTIENSGAHLLVAREDPSGQSLTLCLVVTAFPVSSVGAIEFARTISADSQKESEAMTESNGGSRHPLITGGAVLLIVVGLAAWSSNPDEASFRRWVAREVRRDTEGITARVAGNVLSQFALNVVDWEHLDYGFFSVVSFPEEEVAFLGAFGNWWKLETEEEPHP
jgi:hypothetical protein